MLQGKSADIVKITKKYGTTAFMYTQYPHKRFWNRSDDLRFREALKQRYTKNNSPTILYVHMPYCEQLCWFCTCHIAITKNYDKVHHYMQFLKKELDLLSIFCQENNISPDFREVHLGGGSPTFINEADFLDFIKSMSPLLDVKRLDEFAIEIDPRRVDRQRMHFYADHGINRISFGVQDFDLKVQEAVNRVQPAYLIENLITKDIRERFANGVNFDILVGLPHQTPESMENTCKKIIDISPDRICMNYMHYSPELAKHQTIMMDGLSGRPDRLPDFLERKNIFMAALETLTGGGYVRTGYDHFAKPDDANAIALTDGKIQWNDLGITPGRVTDSIGIGVSSRSNIGDSYFENYYELVDYERSLNNAEFPIYRSHTLNTDEKIRRDVILSLRNYFKVFFNNIEDEYSVCFRTYFSKEIEKLKDFQDDGIVEVRDDGIFITEFGYQVANLVCRVFDKYYQDNILAPDLGERRGIVGDHLISVNCSEFKNE